MEEDIDGGAVGVVGGFADVGQFEVGFADQVIVGSGDQDLSRSDPIAFDGQSHGQGGLFVEPGGEAGGKLTIDMLNNDDRDV